MITEVEKSIILQCAEKYNVTAVFLFGSAVEQDDVNDIDLGIKGISPELFFKLYTELVKRLTKPVDLVDLSFKSLFNDIVEENGMKIYG
jgi:predicted nucleotidyltransferase